MKPKVTNLKLSKLLKKASYPQEGYFWWQYTPANGYSRLLDYKDCKTTSEYFVAPTVAELGEALPLGATRTRSGEPNKNDDRWICYYVESNPDGGEDLMPHWEFGNTEANARARMWLALKKKGLL